MFCSKSSMAVMSTALLLGFGFSGTAQSGTLQNSDITVNSTVDAVLPREGLYLLLRGDRIRTDEEFRQFTKSHWQCK